VAYGLCSIDRGLYEAGILFKNRAIGAKVIEMVNVDPGRI
jgi:hypothetical protein